MKAGVELWIEGGKPLIEKKEPRKRGKITRERGDGSDNSMWFFRLANTFTDFLSWSL